MPPRTRHAGRRAPTQEDPPTHKEDHRPRRSARIATQLQSFKVPVASTRTPLEVQEKAVKRQRQPRAPPKPSPSNTRPRLSAKAQGSPKRATRSQRRATVAAAPSDVRSASRGKQASEKAVPPNSPKAVVQENLQIASWFERLPHSNSPPPGDLTAGEYLVSNFNQKVHEDMATTSATSISRVPASGTPSQAVATATTAGQDADKLRMQLCLRNADPDEATADPLLEPIRGLLNIKERVQLISCNTGKLREIMQKFIDTLDSSTKDQDVFEEFEIFQNEMNAWKPAHKLFTLTNNDFDFDRLHSLRNNEAVLQRTILTSILDRWRLNQMFTFDCEGHWKMVKQSPLPASQETRSIGGLKADLVLFYRFEIFAGMKFDRDTAFPISLNKYAFPDGNTRRCFPFVFIEAKRGEKDLTYAKYCNMLNASQALWNIYQWMIAGKQGDAFFEHVRVFSISLNAEKLVVHVHRAVQCPAQGEEPGNLKFLFDELYTLHDYSRDEASLLIRNTLLEYGVARLRGYLVAAYEEIIGRQLPKLSEIEELWKLPEVRDAVERMEASRKEADQNGVPADEGGSDTATEADADGEAEERPPVQLESSKRRPPAKSSGRSKRTKRKKSQDVGPTTSFGASHLSLE